MSIVIDASVALKWIFDEAGSDAALALRADELIAPILWLGEAANALWRHVRLGEVTAKEALELMSELAKAPVTPVSIEPYVLRALQLAADLNHPVYDCLYLALALDRQTHVITDDRRFAAAANKPGFEGRVLLLGDEPPPTRRRRRRGGPSR